MKRILRKYQLAMAYSPKLTRRQATSRFNYWLSQCPDLMKALSATGFTLHQRILTPRQVELIYHFLGSPADD